MESTSGAGTNDKERLTHVFEVESRRVESWSKHGPFDPHLILGNTYLKLIRLPIDRFPMPLENHSVMVTGYLRRCSARGIAQQVIHDHHG